MSEAVAQTNGGELTLEAVLAARQETFLAHYSRKAKVLFAAAILLVIILFALQFGGGDQKHNAAYRAGQKAAQEEQASSVRIVPQTVFEVSTKRVPRYLPKTESEMQAAAVNDSDEPTRRMGPAPDASLVETLSLGALPKVSPDGRKPWQNYARPFDHRDPRPRIALVVSDLGLSRVATDAAIRRLPASVTLAFDVQGTAIDAWLNRARADGHETLLSLPMEPFDYPRSDPGAQSLLTKLPNSDNIQRLLGFLSVGSGYVGITTLSGSRFSADIDKMTPVLEELNRRGLLALDAKVASHSVIGSVAKQLNMPVAVNTRTIDTVLTPEAVDAALSDLEQTARVEGAVVAMASPLPVTLERIENWAKELSARGIVLAPLSAIAE